MSADGDTKRRRVTIACNRCRGQKLRCDGVQPTCGRCAARKTTCDYPKKFVRANVSEEYVRHLEMSLGIVQSNQSDDSGGKNPGNPSRSTTKTPEIEPVMSQQPPSSENKFEVRAQAFVNAPQAQPAQAALQFTPATQQPTPTNGRKQSKSPSAFSFMCLVEAALSAGREGDETNSSSGDDSTNDFLDKSPPKSGLYASIDWLPRQFMADWKLPPYAVASVYISSYFSYAYPLCPFIHEPSFMAAYETLREVCASNEPDPLLDQNLSKTVASGSSSGVVNIPLGSESGESDGITSSATTNTTTPSPHKRPEVTSPFPASGRFVAPNRDEFFTLSEEDQQLVKRDANIFQTILNLVFALGCLHSPTRIDQSDVPVAQLQYERAQRIYQEFVVDKNHEDSSLILLQAQLLQAQYLQATSQRDKCLAAIARAVHNAQELGLYSEKIIATRGSITERELCRRMWYGCLVMDRSISLSYGRPMFTSRSFEVRVPEVYSDNYVSEREVLEPSRDQPTLMSFFEQSVGLYGILADIMAELYTDTGSCNTKPATFHSISNVLSRILVFDEQLSKFRNGLPPYLRTVEDDAQASWEDSFKWQAMILQIRYLHVVIMLCRPILVPHHKALLPAQSDLSTMLAKAVSSMCIDSSLELVNIIWRVRDVNMMPTLWSTNYYTYTAALIIVTAIFLRKRQDQDIGYDLKTLERAWSRASQLLHSFQKQGHYIDKGLQALTACYAKIETNEVTIDDILSLEFLPENSSEVWGFDVDILSNAFGEKN